MARQKTETEPKTRGRKPRQESSRRKPYATGGELLQAMKKYFADCALTADWQEVCTGMAELAAKAEEKGSWDGLEKDYAKLLALAQGEVFPDEAGMRIALQLSHETYLGYKEDPAYKKVFDWAMDMRESWLARRLAAEPKMAQAYLNALKQPANGGWVDRRTDTGDKTIGVKILDVGGEEAFK